METFAPAYFDYMSSAVSADVSEMAYTLHITNVSPYISFQRPTLLAKVFGCYKITFRRNSKDRGGGRSKVTQMNLLVMENLFYDRRFSKVGLLLSLTRCQTFLDCLVNA